MKKTLTSFGAIVAIIALTAPAASAQTCHQQAVDLQKRQVEAQKLAETRLVLLDEVELAGDAWENAEAVRNFGEAEKADSAKATYDSLKADLLQKEASLQAMVASLNNEVTVYNAKCIKK